jgi:hypothetical protein
MDIDKVAAAKVAAMKFLRKVMVVSGGKGRDEKKDGAIDWLKMSGTC